MSKIYSATYSNVPVYEYNVGGNHVMRRRSDDWINATHILKVADFDKPARTRILEREVQKGIHEKVQGGYGKYQGTWIPLEEGRQLAERNGVLDKLLPIFDFVPGDRSPPPAPKHATNNSSKPKSQRQSAANNTSSVSTAPRKQPVVAPPQTHQFDEMSYDGFDGHINEMGGVTTPAQASYMSESDSGMIHGSQHSSRKRKRDHADYAQQQQQHPQTMSYEDQQHLLWTDELLDYFMLQNSDDPLPAPPEPPATINLNRSVDDKGHTPMHWAAAMGDLTVVHDLMERGAQINSISHNGETPLMRAVMFTNNWDKQTMDRLIHILYPAVGLKDWFGSTVFHHIAATTCSKSKYQCARYYLECILAKLSEAYGAQEIRDLLDQQDQNGDTAILLAARNGARRCVRCFLERRAGTNIPNNRGETANEVIEQLNARRRDRYNRQGSSSPVVGPSANMLLPSSSQADAMQSNGVNASANSHRHHGHRHSTTDSAAAATAASLLRGDTLVGSARTSSGSTFYRSEAATLVSSQLPTLITSRTEALAVALEAELAERETEAREAERLLEQRKRDLENLRRQSAALAVQIDEESISGEINEQALERQRGELSSLIEHSRSLIETEQAYDLQNLLSSNTAGVLPSSNGNSNAADSTEALQEKTTLAYALLAAQTQRERLVQEMLSAETMAGAAASLSSPSSSSSPSGALSSVTPSKSNGNTNGRVGGGGGGGGRNVGPESSNSRVISKEREKNMNLYKRIIYGTVGVRPEDVDAVLPDLLRELEEAAGQDPAAGDSPVMISGVGVVSGGGVAAGRGFGGSASSNNNNNNGGGGAAGPMSGNGGAPGLANTTSASMSMNVNMSPAMGAAAAAAAATTSGATGAAGSALDGVRVMG